MANPVVNKRSRTRRTRKTNSTEYVLITSSHEAVTGAGDFRERRKSTTNTAITSNRAIVSRSTVVNSRSGSVRRGKWNVRFSVEGGRWSMWVDARDLAKIAGDKILAHHRRALFLDVDPRNGKAQKFPLEQRAKVREVTASNIRGGLRRTFVGKDSRNVNKRRSRMIVYFQPNPKGRKFPNPQAAFNKLEEKRGTTLLSLEGEVDAILQEALDEWSDAVVSGEAFPVDTFQEAGGK